MHPEPGFQLFMTQRSGGEGVVREELAKLVRTVTVPQLPEEELRLVLAAQFPGLASLTEKILRMFRILSQPGLIEGSSGEQARIVNTLRHGRQVGKRQMGWSVGGHDGYTGPVLF